MASHNNGDGPLKTAIVRKLRADMDAVNITGLDSIPLIIQDRPLNSVSEPYIYVRVETSSEVDVTQREASREYTVIAEVVVRSDQNSAATSTRDDIVNEMVAILDVETEEYISVENYHNYIQNVRNVDVDEYEYQGATYHWAEVEIMFRMNYTGDPRSAAAPNVAASYSYADWEFTPVANRLEYWDSGTITGASTYANTGGFTFSSASYQLPATTDLSISGNVVTAERGDTAGLDITSTLNWTRSLSGTTINRSRTRTTNFERIRSIRYGSIAPIAASQVTSLTAFDSAVSLNNSSTHGSDEYRLLDSNEDHLDAGDSWLDVQWVGAADASGTSLRSSLAIGDEFLIYDDADNWAMFEVANDPTGVTVPTDTIFVNRLSSYGDIPTGQVAIYTDGTSVNVVDSSPAGGTASAIPTFEDTENSGIGFRDVQSWVDTGRFVDFRSVDPNGFSKTFDATAGDHLYFVLDESEGALRSITNIAGGVEEETISQYDTGTDGGYRWYRQTRALSFTDSYTIRLEQ